MTPISRSARWQLMAVLDDHPALAVVLFTVVGLLMMFGSIRDGSERAPFIGGPQAVGVVAKLERAGMMPRRHHAVVRWDYPAGVSHSATVQLYKREFERLQKGGTIELLLAPHDPGQAMTAYRLLEGDSVIRIGPLTSTTFIFAGLAIFLFGLIYPALPRLKSPHSESVPLVAQIPEPPRQPTERRIECPACSEYMEDTGRREGWRGHFQIMKCPKCENEAAVDTPRPRNSTQR